MSIVKVLALINSRSITTAILYLINTGKRSIVGPCKFFREPKKDYWTLFCDAYDDQDGENHDEDGAEGEAELAAMIFDIFARLFDEKSNFLAACQSPATVIVPIFFLSKCSH